MSCGRVILPMPREPDNPERPEFPPLGGTRLITSPCDRLRFSAVRTTDARAALQRGMKEYLEQLAFEEAEGGREMRFRAVFDVWSEPEELAEHPAAIVYATGEGKYDGDNFAPSLNPNDRLDDGRFVVKLAEYEIDLTIECYCTDPEQRIGFSMMLEEALSPVDWMSGVRLELPHYYNARGEYALISNSQPDSADEALRRQRLLTITVRGRLPVLRLSGYPTAKPRLNLTVEGE